MFKDSNVTRLDPWSITEAADAMPAVALPAFVGTGKLGVGLDAAGLQGLPDRLGEHYHCDVEPFHRTQSELYVLREGMVSGHLWDDEIALTGKQPFGDHDERSRQRNFLPLGFLDQAFTLGGETVDGDGIRPLATRWRRDWDLRTATVRTAFDLGRRDGPSVRVGVEAFAPHGSEVVYLHLTRSAATRPGPEGTDPAFAWTVRLRLATRHGLAIFDEPDAVAPGTRTLLATIGPASARTPAEPYAVVYGVAADGMELALDAGGWTATLRGELGTAQEAWLRLEFRRHAGDAVAAAPAAREALETELAAFDRAEHAAAAAAHAGDLARFWADTAEIEVVEPTGEEARRGWLLHLSKLLVRTANDQTLGGTAQFLLVHQNGWRACNFHDHHYIIDGVARANLWTEAEGHLRWMRSVMADAGRPFPWMMTYDGASMVPPERDRAPMSDANRALLALKLYALAGDGREDLLAECVYPILRAVAEHGLRDWLTEEDGALVFGGVENDVMDDEARRHEIGTVVMYVTVLRQAAACADRLGVDADRAAAWRAAADRIPLPVAAGRYVPWKDAPPEALTTVWFNCAYYVSEAQAYLDDATYARTRDHAERKGLCNLAWIHSANASSEIRLGRPERAEQFLADVRRNTVHGPGYFEEVGPSGRAALPPFATAHGAYLTARCEQVVLPDFWADRVYIGRGLPATMRTRHLRFHGLRALRGLVIAGELTPRGWRLELDLRGPAATLELVVTLPAGAGVDHDVRLDGAPAPHRFAGETVALDVDLVPGRIAVLTIDT
ncbi:MAG: hypothetical protein ACOCX4_08695 [Planctomycetota bacterium]